MKHERREGRYEDGKGGNGYGMWRWNKQRYTLFSSQHNPFPPRSLSFVIQGTVRPICFFPLLSHFPSSLPTVWKKGHHQFSEFWHFHVIRDTEKINLSNVSKNFQELILKFSRFKILSGFLIYMWCQGFRQYLTPFLESLEFFKTYAILLLSDKCIFVVEILGQRCNFLMCLGKWRKQ